MEVVIFFSLFSTYRWNVDSNCLTLLCIVVVTTCSVLEMADRSVVPIESTARVIFVNSESASLLSSRVKSLHVRG